MGGRHLPVSGGLLEARALRIATELGVTGFKGSPHFIQNWAALHNLHNVALWGQGGSADVAGAAARIAEIRSELEAYPVERIYKMDETGLFFRCIPNRAYFKAGQRRQARGTKAMKAKDRVTLVSACNATGTHETPVAMIGTAKQPLCFKPPRRPCPLPYFSKTNAWMDGDLFNSWLETAFLPAVRARTSQPVALVSDNCGAHEELECDKVKFIPLSPNCTSIYQPLDLGIIACLKRRYKRRLLDLVVSAFEASSGVRMATGSARGGEGGAHAAGSPSAAGGGTPHANSSAGADDGGDAHGAASAAPDAWRGSHAAAGSTRGGGGAAPAAGSASAASGGGARADVCVRTADGGGPHPDASVGAPTQPFSACVPAGADLAADGAASAAGMGAESSVVSSAGPAGQETSGIRLWLSVDGWWPAIASHSEDAVSAARPTAPNVASSAARLEARLEVRRAARRQMQAARRAARLEVRRAARHQMQASRLAAPTLSSAAAVSGNNTPVAAAGPGIWGLPSDWLAALDSAQPKRRRYARASARCAEIRDVRDGAGAQLQDASEILLAEWEAVAPSTGAHCWVKSTILPAGVAMDVTALHGEYRGSSHALGTDMDAVVSLLGGCTFGSQSFRDTPTAARELAVQSWLTAEEDEGVLAATADQIAIDEGGEGDATQGGGSDPSDGGDSGDSDGGGSDGSDGEGSDDLDGGGGGDSDTEASEDVADSNYE